MKTSFPESNHPVGQQESSFDLAQAGREGWIIEYSCTTSARLRGIGQSDLEAWWHVARAAAHGSPYHCAALAELAPEERLAIEVHCGPIEIPFL